MNTSTRRSLLLAGGFAVLSLVAARAAAQEKRSIRQFICVLRLVPRLQSEAAWTEADNKAVAAHFQRLKQATDADSVILAGRTNEAPDKTFGLVVFEALDIEAARAFMESDPAVVAGVMTATLHPYSVALLRK